MELTPKQQAKIIYDEFYLATKDSMDILNIKSKQTALTCSIICVNKILTTEPMIENGCTDSGTEYRENDDYWEEVKTELYNIE